MEHFRIILTQQKEALLTDSATLRSKIETLELEADALKESKKAVDSELRRITKKLEKI